MPAVVAIIVTYKRVEALRKCIDSLLKNQAAGLKRIHVVINAPDEETTRLLQGYAQQLDSLISIQHLNNEGPAGGFHFGLKNFLETGLDYAWLMDDDIVVGANALAEMLKYADEHPYIFPKVVKGNGEEVISFGWWGVLLSRHIVEKAGLPLKDLFYWAEDTEYLQNRLMRVHGFKPFRCDTAVVEHLHNRKRQRPSWYYYYTVRNTLYYRIYIQENNLGRRIRRTLVMFPSLLFSILKERRKFKKLRFMFLGTVHGLTARTGKRIDPETNA